VSSVAPTIRNIRPGYAGHIARFAIFHGQAIQVAAILGRQPSVPRLIS
jgi:hypothetical protein